MMEQEINSGVKNQKNQLPEAFSKQISLARLGYLCKDTSGDSFHDQKLVYVGSCVVLTGIIERGLVFSRANFELGEGILLCNGF